MSNFLLFPGLTNNGEGTEATNEFASIGASLEQPGEEKSSPVYVVSTKSFTQRLADLRKRLETLGVTDLEATSTATQVTQEQLNKAISDAEVAVKEAEVPDVSDEDKRKATTAFKKALGFNNKFEKQIEKAKAEAIARATEKAATESEERARVAAEEATKARATAAEAARAAQAGGADPYYARYMKYKNKYLALKKELGM